MKKKDWNIELELNHNESPAIVNNETGELNILKLKQRNKSLKDNTMKSVSNNGVWSKYYTAAWRLLETQVNAQELLIAYKMAVRARAFTNSLEPLAPNSTITYLSEELNIDRRSVEKIIDKLFRLGVIGKFEVYQINEQYKNYWIFNPFLSFNGGYIKKEVESLFVNTYYAKQMQS